MKHASDHLRFTQADTRPWLIIGKGPSYRKGIAQEYRDKGYSVVGINEVVNHEVCDYGIFNDIGVAANLTPAAIHTTSAFYSPAYPHSFLLPDCLRIDQMAEVGMGLSLMKHKLYGYDLSVSHTRHFEDSHPVIVSICSTFESIIWLLAHAGVKQIATSGIDYSQDYHDTFGPRLHITSFSGMKYYIQVAVDSHKLDIAAV